MSGRWHGGQWKGTESSTAKSWQLVPTLRIHEARCLSTGLCSQDKGGRDRRIGSSRPAWATW